MMPMLSCTSHACRFRVWFNFTVQNVTSDQVLTIFMQYFRNCACMLVLQAKDLVDGGMISTVEGTQDSLVSIVHSEIAGGLGAWLRQRGFSRCQPARLLN